MNDGFFGATFFMKLPATPAPKLRGLAKQGAHNAHKNY